MGRKYNKFKSQRGSYYLLTGFIGLAMIGSFQFVVNRLSAIKAESVRSAIYTSFEKRPVTVSFAGNPQVSSDYLATLEVAAKESSSKAGSVNVAAQLWMKNTTPLAGTIYEFVGGIDANSAPTAAGDLTITCSDMISALEGNASSEQPNFIVVAFVPGLDTVCRVTEAGVKEEGSAITPPPPPDTGGGGPFEDPPIGGGGGGGGICIPNQPNQSNQNLNSPDNQQSNSMPSIENCV